MIPPGPIEALSRCDVCLGEFEPVTPGQRRCSEPCREFVRQHKRAHSSALPGMWEAAQNREQRARVTREALERQRARPCPGGKVRHHSKRDARKALRRASRWYRAVPGWLRIYRCPDCDSWHLTSRPARVEDIVAGPGGDR